MMYHTEDDVEKSGQELAASWLGRLSTKGALSGQEQDQREREVAELSEEELAEYISWMESGFCRSCEAAGMAEKAVEGSEYCADCKQYVDEDQAARDA